MFPSFQSAGLSRGHLHDGACPTHRTHPPDRLSRRRRFPCSAGGIAQRGGNRGGRAMTAKVKEKAIADFLFEIGCEEIPAGMLPGAMKELKVILEKYLSAHSLALGSAVQVYGAHRRPAASCASVRVRQPDEIKDIQGPSKSVAFDSSGRPTAAAE